jgi:hypothetical protein
LNGALFLIGGSKSKYRYADDPSKVWVLPKNGERWRDDIFPPLIGSRMWPGCTLANIEGQVKSLKLKFVVLACVQRMRRGSKEIY